MDNNIIGPTKVNSRLLQVANTILCNFSMTTTPNLINGRMGVCLFLYEYARFTGIKEYEDIADEMIDLILKILHKGQGEDNITTLSEIGIGVVYLIARQFLEDTDDHDSLEEVDKLLLKTIESAKEPSLMVVQSALYFIYRFSYYRVGLDKGYCYKVAGQLVNIFQNHECASEEDGKVWKYILHNAMLIYRVSQEEGFSQCKDNYVFLEIEHKNWANQINADDMWKSFLFGRKTLGDPMDDDTLSELCCNCFYDSDRVMGILCSYGMMEIVNK